MDGQRIAKSEGSRKRGWIIAGAAASVLAAAYLTTCAWVSGKDAILPNVSVAGIDVSNMLVEQARAKETEEERLKVTETRDPSETSDPMETGKEV